MNLQAVVVLPDEEFEEIPHYLPGDERRLQDEGREGLPVAQVTAEVSADQVEAVVLEETLLINGRRGDVCNFCLQWSADVDQSVCPNCAQEIRELGFIRLPEFPKDGTGAIAAPGEWLPVNVMFDTALTLAQYALQHLDRMRELVIGIEIRDERPVIRLAREPSAGITGERACAPSNTAEHLYVCSVPFAGCLLEWRRP